MSLHFAYGRTTLSSSDWSITVNTGGGNLTGATKYFSLQAQNPIGKNLQLISSPITFQTGDSITFTINESALTEAEGWTHYVIGVSNSATPSTFNQIARINIYDLSTGSIDFDTQEVFPLTLTIDENAQLETATYVADKESLPTTNLIYGMRRGVTENNCIYEYNPFAVISPNDDDILSADVGVWLKKEEFSTYVEDIAQYGGCAYDLYNLNDFSQVELPAYNADGTNSLRVKYYLINNSSFTLQPGTGITLSAQIGGVERTEIFDGKIYYRINGVVTPTDGTLRTTSTITGQPLDFIDTDYVYTKATPVTISKDYINNQTGLYIDVYVNFLNLEFNNLLPDGYLQIFLSYISPKGVFTPVGTLFEKGIIYNKYNKRRVLPDIGLNVVVGEGEGLVKNFAWYSCNTTVSGLTANTANQKLYVNINGVVFPDVAERTSSVLRAIVDTTVKESKISTWTSYSAVTANAALTVTVDYECDSDLNQQIRDTYPDVIAGDWGIFNPTRLNIYVQRQSDGEIRKFTGFIPAGNNVSQEFIITDWSSGTVVGSVPSSSASFFDPTTNTFSTTASAGNFTSGNYRIAHTYVWNGDTVSDVSHSVAVGCISESQVNGEQVFGTTTYNTIAQIKAEENLYDGFRLYCKNTQQLYVYDENSTLDDDDNFVLLPDSGVGRWVSVVINKRSTFIKTVAPTITDDENDGYVVGDKWLDTVAGEEYTLLDASVGAADWQQLGGGDISYNDLTDLPTLGTAAALDVNEPNGVCGLDGSGKVSSTYLPSYVDDVLEYANLAGFPVTGETGKIYVALDNNRTYRWSGSVYVEVSNPFSGSYDDLTDKPTIPTTAAEITVDTTNLNVNLSGADNTVQKAIETLDELVAGGGGHTIQDEGTPLTQRTNLNFVGTGVTATDNAGTDTTTVTVNLPSTGSGLNLGEWDSSGTFTSGVRFDGSGDKVILPAVDTATRTGSTPLQGELVYDTDLDKFFYGDGVTVGGVEVGSGSDGREVLTADRTYYVRTDGSDSNNGLTNTSGGAFLTIQKAIDIAAALDWGVYNVTLKLGDGTYTLSTPLVLKRGVGYGVLRIEGNTTSKTNVKLDGSGSVTVAIRPLSNLCNVIIDSLELRNFQTGFADWDLSDYTNTAATETSTTMKDISFYNMTSRAIYLASPSNLFMLRGTANRFEKTSTNATSFCTVLAADSAFDANSTTITMVGSPSFSSTYWLDVQRMAKGNIVSLTVSGSYTGSYLSASGSMIYINGATGINSGITSGTAWILT